MVSVITDLERARLPSGYVILGYGGDFEQDEPEFSGLFYSRLGKWLPATCIGDRQLLYAVKKDSSMAELNKKKLLPENSTARKQIPLYRGTFGQYPLSMIALAKGAYNGWQKHNGGEAGWNREISSDHMDCLLRHALDGDWEEFICRAHMIAELGLEAQQS